MKNRIYVVLTVALLLMFALTACGGLKDISKLGDQFMSALSTGDHSTSFKMLSPDIQSQVGGEAGWAEWASIRNFNEWKFNSKSVENGVGTLLGTAKLGDEEYKVTLEFTETGDQWLITTIVFE